MPLWLRRSLDPHAHPDMGFFDRGRIVHPIACHGHNFPIGLESSDDGEFMARATLAKTAVELISSLCCRGVKFSHSVPVITWEAEGVISPMLSAMAAAVFVIL